MGRTDTADGRWMPAVMGVVQGAAGWIRVSTHDAVQIVHLRMSLAIALEDAAG
jgi:uncharacterized membrane protein HdeD (DUF308 family)